ncbi:hypothetical protein [Deinococcus sp. S9]|uniref:hypothetical protein n=1 Tax=Deinococcus sp. S9 TaxID=2545754 RepID=UPI0014050AF7|nr:hypothetical protein [Deinococcus sp. S9]
MQRLRARFALPFSLQAQTVHWDLDVGLVPDLSHYTSPDEVLQAALLARRAK